MGWGTGEVGAAGGQPKAGQGGPWLDMECRTWNHGMELRRGK